MHSLIWMTFFFHGCNLFPIHLWRRRRWCSVRYANLQVPEPVGNVPIRILSPYLKLLAWKVNKLFSMLLQVTPPGREYWVYSHSIQHFHRTHFLACVCVCVGPQQRQTFMPASHRDEYFNRHVASQSRKSLLIPPTMSDILRQLYGLYQRSTCTCIQ